MPVYRELIDTVRRGNLVTALPLSYRLLALTLDVHRADELIARYIAATPPQAWAYDEAGQFQEFVASSAPAGLVGALRRGVRPRPQAGEYEVVIDP